MKIYLGADHAGYAYKELLQEALMQRDDITHVVDYGARGCDDDDDYPDFIRPVAEAVAADWAHGTESRGIILGGSGQGEAMVANRIKGIRAAVYYGGPQDIITLSRKHNDANVLALGARFLSQEEMLTMVALWLDTDFSFEERHTRRITKIDTIHHAA